MIGSVLIALAQAALVAAVAPLVVGLTRLLKARLIGRRGAPPWQPYLDLRKLFGKEVVVSEHASWIFRATPAVLFATMVVAAAVVPVLVARPAPVFAGSLIVVMYLFLLGTFFLALAGLDTASAFGGMGSSREVAVAALAEPTVILTVLALALRSGTTDLGGIVERLEADPRVALDPASLLAFAAFFIVMLAETSRLPVDNPATHLELTMIHEAMILEYSGRYLALVEWAAAMKLTLFMTLLATLFIPWPLPGAVAPGAILASAVALGVKLVVLAAVLALVETSVAKLRLFRVPELLAGSFALALLAVTAVFLVR